VLPFDPGLDVDRILDTNPVVWLSSVVSRAEIFIEVAPNTIPELVSIKSFVALRTGKLPVLVWDFKIA
jgi:hypothetical protein